jgi:hypothetical protein
MQTRTRRFRLPRGCQIGCGVAAALFLLLIVIAATHVTVTPNSQATQPTTTKQTSQPTQGKPTPQAVHYPPKTQADLRALAAKGDANAIHAFHRESVGLTGVCPQPKIEATVAASLTGQQLAEDLLAYFYSQQLDNPCGSVVFAYHSQSEAGNGYTAGRVLLTVYDASGTVNSDPNATNLKYTVTLDVGGFDNSQEYVITY